MVNAVGNVVESSEHEILANILQISSEVAHTIKYIEAEQLYELDLENRRQKLSQFQIIIRVTDNQSIPLVSNGLYDYFNKNAYSNKNYTLFKKQSPELITYLDQEIDDLKSYRDNIKNKSNLELSSISIANDKSELLQNQIIQLYEKKQSIERDLELLKPLSFVSSFAVYENPKGRTLFRTSIMSLGLLIIGFIIALFRDVNAILRK
jgi:transposase